MQSGPGRSGLSQAVLPTDYRDRKVVATLNDFSVVQSQCGPSCKIKFAVIVIKRYFIFIRLVLQMHCEYGGPMNSRLELCFFGLVVG